VFRKQSLHCKNSNLSFVIVMVKKDIEFPIFKLVGRIETPKAAPKSPFNEGCLRVL